MSVPDYSLDRLAERASRAKEYFAAYLQDLEVKYSERRTMRHERGTPVVAYCGMGRAGKDTSAEYVCGRLGLVYPKSSSWMVLPLVAHMAGVPAEQAWAERHQVRVFWIHACNALRVGDLTLIGRLCLGAGDVLVGPRALPEFREYVRSGMVDWTVWIDKDVPKDPTVEFTEGDCDLSVANHGTKEDLFRKWDKLMPVLYGMFPTKET